MDALIRFHNFTYKSETGELIQLDESGKETVSRLQPQPGKLLQLLLDNYPNVVSRDQIQEAIWPDVQVDFDGSMHFCIRQIRTALNDNATDPEFIETIPRRGYRWIAAIKDSEENEEGNQAQLSQIALEVDDKSPFTKSLDKDRSHLKRFWLWGLIGMAIISFLFYLLPLELDDANTLAIAPDKIRIAIMPFQPEDEANTFTGNDIAFRLLEILTNRYPGQFEIIGPTTTLNYKQEEIRKLVADFQIDVIINGKFSIPENKNRLLVEVIRSSDGAHVWVKAYDATTPSDLILKEIEEGVAEHFLKYKLR